MSGRHVPVRADLVSLDSLSVHADRSELLDWLGTLDKPRHVFVTHGEPEAAEALRSAIEARLGWEAGVPDGRASLDL